MLLAPLLAIHLAACSRQQSTTASGLQIEPSVVDIAPGEAVKFTAVGETSVEWSVVESGGGWIDTDGTYTAPDAEGTYHVIAQTSGTVSGSAEIRISRRNAAVVTLTPRAGSVAAGGTLAFEATVSGAPGATVTWSVAEGAQGGTITAGGVYTAPADAGVYHVVATTAGHPAASGTATVTVTPSVPTGPQYYVATSGDDANPGTIGAPWRTIQKAMSAATPGSTVNIRGGTYRELLTMKVSGTPGNPITFQPYGFSGSSSCGGYTGNACPGESVVLDYSSFGTLGGGQQWPALLISGKQYVVVRGLVFQNYSVDGPMHVGIQVDGGSHHVEFRWNVVKNFQNVHPDGMDYTSMLAVFRAGWGSTKADDVTVADCAFLNSKTNSAEVVTFDLGSSNGVVERTWVSDTDGIALHCFRNAHHLTFRDNRVDWAGIKRDGSLYYPWFGPTGQALYNDGCHDTVWERNVVTHSSYGMQSLQEPPNASQGLPAAGDSYNVIFRNNVVRDGMTGMTLGTWYSRTDGSSVHDTSVYNNTFYNLTMGFQVLPFDAATVKVRNNIVANCGSWGQNPFGWSTGTALDYNLYFNSGRGPDVHQLNLDPRFTNAPAGDFSLLPGSPAIDAGDPATTPALAGDADLAGAPRVVGPWIDLGAVERR